MADFVFNSLSNDEETNFKNLGSKRNDWLLSGTDEVSTPEYTIDEMAKDIYDEGIELTIKRIGNENSNYKSVVIGSNNPLATFKAGQRISVTFKINDKLITRPFSLYSSNAEALDGEYKILIFNNPDDPLLQEVYENVKNGEKVTCSKPFGNFYFSSIRDANDVIAIISDNGIAPIYSMIQAIIAKEENFNLTVYYSVKKFEDLLFYDELKEYDEKSDKIKIYYVLSEEERDDCLNGYVTADMLREEMKEYTSFFISGGEGLLKYLNKELESFKLPKKYIRYDEYLPKCNIRKIVEYKLTIYIDNEKFVTKCYNNRTIIDSITEAGIFIPSKCHNGSCGFCNSELVMGKVKIVNDKRDGAMKEHNYIHPCCTYPLSDVEIIVR
jgi:ferredoxin-NADP reductase